MHEVPAFLIVPIPILYLVFAYQLWLDTKAKQDSKQKKALWYLTGVFIGCALCGYVPRLFTVPVWISDVTHIFQIIITGALVYTRQTRHLARALDDA